LPRYELTRKILEQYKYISLAVKDRATVSFTLLGSPDEKYIVDETQFINYTYHNFNQSLSEYDDDFWKMLACKINTGMKLAIKSNPDIVLWVGSNDYVSLHFYNQIISEYSPTVKQTYGVSQHVHSRNVILITNHHYKTDEFKDNFYWDGNQRASRASLTYCGIVLGMNSLLYNTHPDVMDIWNHDEGAYEKFMFTKPDVVPFIGNEIFAINPKSPSLDLNSYTRLTRAFRKSRLYLERLSSGMQSLIKEELTHWREL
jgi:hypothetical protein